MLTTTGRQCSTRRGKKFSRLRSRPAGIPEASSSSVHLPSAGNAVVQKHELLVSPQGQLRAGKRSASLPPADSARRRRSAAKAGVLQLHEDARAEVSVARWAATLELQPSSGARAYRLNSLRARVAARAKARGHAADSTVADEP